jgi:hypothetical protein
MEPDELHEGVSPSLSSDRNRQGIRAPLGNSTTKTRETTAQQRRATALQIGSLAAAGYHAADDIEEHFPQIARYVHDAAAGFDHVSSFLRDPNLDEVANFIGNLGRKQPAAAIAGVFLLAVGLSWLLRSSGGPSDSFGAAGREERAYGIH